MRPNKRPIFILSLSIIILLIGCSQPPAMADPNRPASPDITPIPAPDGIRDQFTVDYLAHFATRDANTSTPFTTPIANEDGLKECNSRPAVKDLLLAFPSESGVFQIGISNSICGWDQVGSKVTYRITLADNTVINGTTETRIMESGIANPPIGVYIQAEPFLFEPQNSSYELSLEGEGKQFSATYAYGLPIEPQIYQFREDIWLYGYAPNETVEIFRYQLSVMDGIGQSPTGTYVLAEFGTYQVGEDGTLELKDFLHSQMFSDTSLVVSSELSGDKTYGIPIDGSILIEEEEEG